MATEKDTLEPCTLCKTAPALPESYVRLCQECTNKVRQQLTDGKFLGWGLKLGDVIKIERVSWLEPPKGEESLEETIQRGMNQTLNDALDLVRCFMYGWGFDWMKEQCPRCGKEKLAGRDCSCPPDGMVYCPSCITTPGPLASCVLCKGTGYVEEL